MSLNASIHVFARARFGLLLSLLITVQASQGEENELANKLLQKVVTLEDAKSIVGSGVCMHFDVMAANIAERRQARITMADTVRWFNLTLGFKDEESARRETLQTAWKNKWLAVNPRKFGLAMIQTAYKIPLLSSEKEKAEMILEFRNKAFSDCFK